MRVSIWDLLLKQPFEEIMAIAAREGITVHLDENTGWWGYILEQTEWLEG